jgi:hypothetical protein
MGLGFVRINSTNMLGIAAMVPQHADTDDRRDDIFPSNCFAPASLSAYRLTAVSIVE